MNTSNSYQSKMKCVGGVTLGGIITDTAYLIS
jgi:hypothetical protein